MSEPMATKLVPLLFAAAILLSCSTVPQIQEEPIQPWENSQIFTLPSEAGFQWETVELNDGRFRYWFAGDVKVSNPPKYPITGAYAVDGNQLMLAGRKFSVRALNGTNTLWKPFAVDYWNAYQIIDSYGILIPSSASVRSGRPSLRPYFTPEQWEHSANQLREFGKRK